MKRTIPKFGKNRKHGHRHGHQWSNMVKVKGGLPRASRRTFSDWVIGAVAIIFVASLFALSLLVPSMAQAPVSNAGSSPFANPSEIRYTAAQKRLRGVMKIISGPYDIPNVGRETLRQYRGWDPAVQPEPTPTTKPGPGPTLRARLGDQVQISFLNKIDDSQFAYTFDTEPKPGLSSFGCDRSGTFDTKTGTYLPYPGNDVFPNCFHGSSTANIHFHGTHTSPDGLGDNVLVQVLPQTKQPEDQEPWLTIFEKIFNSPTIPQKWMDMPPVYRQQQEAAIGQRDADAAAAAKKNGLLPPESLSAKNQEMIASGQWPQYIVGAFPNFFDIPDYDAVPGKYKAGQAPGTHWYHAHKHGSTSLHIRNGLAGAFVIESSQEGGYDHFIRKTFGWGNSYDSHEKILVFQQYDATQNLERAVAPPGGKGSIQVLVNGQFTPTITMSPGEVQLWRLVNATEGNLNGLINAGNFTPVGKTTGLFQTTGFTFMQTAQDGVQFSPTNYAKQPFLNSPAPTDRAQAGLVLAAGNRADLLVQAPTTPGVVAFKNTGGNVILFFVNVTGPAATNPSLPATMPAIPTTTWAEMPKFLKDLPALPLKHVPNLLQFQWEPGRVGAGRKPTFPPHFMINGKQFAATGEIVDQCMPQDGLQDWILENHTKGAAHPFHIHINPFQVIQIDTPAQPDATKPPVYSSYTPTDNFVWQDVIAIPPAIIVPGKDGQPPLITPGRVRIRHTFLDFPGTYVLHCHILAHEDRGMMQLVRVVPADKYPNGCQGTIPAHH